MLRLHMPSRRTSMSQCEQCGLLQTPVCKKAVILAIIGRRYALKCLTSRCWPPLVSPPCHAAHISALCALLQSSKIRNLIELPFTEENQCFARNSIIRNSFSKSTPEGNDQTRG